MKRKGKQIGALVLVFLTAVFLAACGESKSSNTAGKQEEPAKSSEAGKEMAGETAEKREAVKSDGYEKFSQLQIGMTEEEVNAILGEPAKVDKAYYYYNITVNGQDMEIQVWINTTSGQVTYISGNFNEDEYRAEFADSKTDLSAAGKLDSGELTSYEDCAEAFQTPGYLISIDEDGVKRYLWVDSNDGHICITFKADGSIKSYVGYC